MTDGADSAGQPVFLAGGSEMGRLMRAHDWARTPLGPPKSWPPSLRLVIRLMLTTSHPMFVFWGPEHICFYNDAYSSSLGPEKHPAMLGGRGRETWDEIWPIIGPQIDLVMSGRGATWHEDHLVPIIRHGRLDEVYWTYSYSPIDDDAAPNGVGGVLVVCTETTGKVLSERKLRESEVRFRAVFQNAGVGMIEIDADWNILASNGTYCRITGRPDTELVGANCLSFTHADDVDAGAQALQSLAAGTTDKISFEKRYLRPDGTIIWVRSNLSRVSEEKGANRFLKVVEDITDTRGVREALRESEARFRAMADSAPAPVWVTTAQGIAFANTAFGEVAGMPPEEITGEVWLSLIHPDDRAHALEQRRKAWADVEDYGFDARFRRADGVERWMQVNCRRRFDAGGALIGFVGIAFDMTALKHNEAKLRESEERLRIALAAGQLGDWYWDVESDMISFSAQAATLFGVDEGPVISWTNMRKLIDPADAPAAFAAVEAAVRDRTDYAIEFRMRQAGGATIWVNAVGRPIFDSANNPAGVIGVVQDITARKQTEARLRELNQTLETQVVERTAQIKLLADLVEGTDAFVQVVGLDWRWLAINKASADEFERIYGVRPKIGDDMRALLAAKPEHRAAIEATWSRALGGDEFTEVGEFGDALLDRRFYEMKYNTLRGPDGERIGAYQFVYDVTERLRDQERLARAEEALRQSQKMEAVGQLTGGIAHDFNNLLTIITGNVDAARRHIGEAGEARVQRALGNAMIGAERAAVLTQRLLAFSRRQPLDPKPTDANKLVSGMSELLHSTLGETIAVETVLAAGLWRIEVDPHQLESAILNLAVNARDAMPDGGRLTIETANTHLDRDYAAQHAGVSPGQYVAICVSDAGEGMDQETLDRVFEPFFTTKEVGRGTGLGLSMVYGFVKQSGGHVKLYSEHGQGTTVRLYLPRFIGGDIENETIDAVAVPEGSRDETILVCEDDDDVRAYTVEVLRELGYRVLEAHDGPAALRLLDRQEGKVDLLFTDVVLPGGMTGAVVAAEARALRPGLKVLFTTGYARNAIVHHGRLDPGVELITKPFSYADLAARVRDVLDRT